MDPLFVKPFTKPKKHWAATRYVLAAMRWVGRTLISRPLALYRPGQQPRVLRLMPEIGRALACQALVVPIALSLTAALLVYVGTHPAVPPITLDPSSQNVYFEKITLNSEDGTALSGWLVPVIDAKRVLLQKDRILRMRDPAIVLVHDFGRTPQQMVSMAGPLHEEGVAVFILGVRGVGSAKTSGQTFGLNESADIRSAVDYLRTLRNIDPGKIAVMGVGTGANAALLATQRDPRIKALILADPVQDVEEVVARRIGPAGDSVKWIRPICKWEFELAYHVTADDLSLDRLNSVTQAHPTLRLPHGSDRVDYFNRKLVAKVQWFVHQQLRDGDATASTK